MAVTLNPDKEVVRAVKEGLKRTEQIADPEFEGFCHCMLYYKSREKG